MPLKSIFNKHFVSLDRNVFLNTTERLEHEKSLKEIIWHYYKNFVKTFLPYKLPRPLLQTRNATLSGLTQIKNTLLLISFVFNHILIKPNSFGYKYFRV
jgi:hypothetical protein